MIRRQQETDKCSKDTEFEKMKAELEEMRIRAAAAEAKETELRELRQQLAATKDEPSPTASEDRSGSVSPKRSPRVTTGAF